MTLRALASARVVHRFWRSARPSTEGLARDLILPQGTRRFRPILGTAEALITTGDINLIRSDSLRAQLPAYVDSMKTQLEDINCVRSSSPVGRAIRPPPRHPDRHGAC